ncbi:hypothetical protein FGO68_gene12571 [Halteria grandinella]|uniref:Uncharacterized protein n=1 Tax=Halteria grandinella TaxID=5974 RepID=A0A8J8NS01_HALGN|nr:hypothetical protein FGO68_gene12571 [Halteria grandinella]
MKMTLQQNKQLLDDYINNIGENDQLVQKLKAEVDSLRQTNANKEEQIKQMNTQLQSLKHSPKQSIATTNFTTHIQETVVAQQTSHNKQQSNQHHGFILVNCPNCKHQFKHAGNSGVSQSQKLLTDSLLRKQKELQAQLETFKQELGQLQEGSNFPTSRLLSKRSISLLSQASTIQPVLDLLQSDLLLFQDTKGCVWQIASRPDLSMADFKMESEQEQCHEEDVGGQESLRIDDIISQRNEKETGGEGEDSDEGDYDEEEEEEDEEEEEYDSESSSRKKSEKIAQERSRALQLLQNSLTKHHNIYKAPSPLKPTQSDIQILNQQSPLPNTSNYISKDGVSRLSHPKLNKNQGGQVVVKSKEVIVSVLNTEEN